MLMRRQKYVKYQRDSYLLIVIVRISLDSFKAGCFIIYADHAKIEISCSQFYSNYVSFHNNIYMFDLNNFFVRIMIPLGLGMK